MKTKEITIEDLGNRQTIRDNSQRDEEIYKISLDKIVIRPEFNKRSQDNYGDIEGLAKSILENGQTLPGRVDVMADGTFWLVDGHRRFEALKILVSQGHDPLFKAIVNAKKTTELERIVQMFTTQDNKPLDPPEISELIRQIKNMGHNQATIAKMLGKSTAYVSQMLDFSREDVDIKAAVTSGKLSVSGALKIKKAIPSRLERSEKIKEAVKNSDKLGSRIDVGLVTGKEPKNEITIDRSDLVELKAKAKSWDNLEKQITKCRSIGGKEWEMDKITKFVLLAFGL